MIDETNLDRLERAYDKSVTAAHTMSDLDQTIKNVGQLIDFQDVSTIPVYVTEALQLLAAQVKKARADHSYTLMEVQGIYWEVQHEAKTADLMRKLDVALGKSAGEHKLKAVK